MEKTFRRYQTKPSARHAFVEAEAVTAIAHQIRIVRKQRGWSQQQLAKLLGTTQANVSRMEDPSYGKLTIRTLLEVARVFDVALDVKFSSIIEKLRKTWIVSEPAMQVETFEKEAEMVGFVERLPSRTILKIEIARSPATKSFSAQQLAAASSDATFISFKPISQLRTAHVVE